MLMLTANINSARQAFINGRYEEALNLYADLAAEVNSAAWNANIRICERRLKGVRPEFLCILDEITQDAMADYFDLKPLEIDNYWRQLRENPGDLLLESAWHGKNGQWENAFSAENPDNRRRAALLTLLREAKKLGKKIIFWNKEDPVHFSRFINIAEKADVILTTDINMVDIYTKICPGIQVECLPFFVNTRLCNPLGRNMGRLGSICFAGTNYLRGHQDRMRQMLELLPALAEARGVIYDRMSQVSAGAYAWPGIYAPFVRPGMSWKEIVHEYKAFAFFLNVNTVTTSPTMLSRRVYELLACGTPVISWPSEAVQKQFGNIVKTATSARQVLDIMAAYPKGTVAWKRLSHLGYREAHTRHSLEARLQSLSSITLPGFRKITPLVSVIMVSKRPQNIVHIAEAVSSQTHPGIEFILVGQGYTREDLEKLRGLIAAKSQGRISCTLLNDDGAISLGQRLNRCVELAQGQYLARFDDDDYYFPNYLADMLLPFTFTDAAIVGKCECFVYLEDRHETWLTNVDRQHAWVDFVRGPTFVIFREVFSKVKFSNLQCGEDTQFLKDAVGNGFKIYAADPFNFILNRRIRDNDHTYRVDSGFFRKIGRYEANGLAKALVSV